MNRMEELVKILNEASNAYYNEDKELMSNKEFDLLYDELTALEKESGVTLLDSPTARAGYEVVSSLKKVAHEYPALSLAKTKIPSEMVNWAGNEDVVLSWKLDGLTVVATYDNGNLVRCETRGNGADNLGEDITHNAKFFMGLPQAIPYENHLVVRGEAAVTYSEWKRINSLLPEDAEPYKNPRNLASGTVRALDSRICKERQVVFSAFKLENTDNLEMDEAYDVDGTFSSQMMFLSDISINTVAWEVVNPEEIPEKIEEWTKKVETAPKSGIKDSYDMPVDGLVFTFEDTSYGDSLGATGHHANSGKAFKWQDETYPTTIKEIFWSASRSGLLNPVAVFEPVEIDNTMVSRASVHNISILRELGISEGSQVTVYKANQIIPQIDENIGEKVEITYPDVCPVCGAMTETHVGKDGTVTLHCTNLSCAAKHIGNFERFVGRDAMNIRGIAEKQLEQLVEYGYLHNVSDFYELTDKDFNKMAVEIERWGQKSSENFKNAIEESKTVDFNKFLYSLGIANFGHDATKLVAKDMTVKEFTNYISDNGFDELDFTKLDGIGEVINDSIKNWFMRDTNREIFYNLVNKLNIQDIKKESAGDEKLKGMTFVITGSLENYANRDALKEAIENLGGKLAGSVSKNTSYLINNDVTSTSGKNKKAQELGVRIISEEDFETLLQK